jgi:hypothetical protein
MTRSTPGTARDFSGTRSEGHSKLEARSRRNRAVMRTNRNVGWNARQGKPPRSVGLTGEPYLAAVRSPTQFLTLRAAARARLPEPWLSAMQLTALRNRRLRRLAAAAARTPYYNQVFTPRCSRRRPEVREPRRRRGQGCRTRTVTSAARRRAVQLSATRVCELSTRLAVQQAWGRRKGCAKRGLRYVGALPA